MRNRTSGKFYAENVSWQRMEESENEEKKNERKKR